MYRNQNVVRLVGQVARDIETGKKGNGQARAVVYLTTKEIYINRDGDQVEQLGWYRATATGRLADQLRTQISRGDQVSIQGKLCHYKYYPKDGPVKQMTEIAIQGFYPLHSSVLKSKNSAPLPF